MQSGREDKLWTRNFASRVDKSLCILRLVWMNDSVLFLSYIIVRLKAALIWEVYFKEEVKYDGTLTISLACINGSLLYQFKYVKSNHVS